MCVLWAWGGIGIPTSTLEPVMIAIAIPVSLFQQHDGSWHFRALAVTVPQYQQFCPDVGIVNWYGQGAKLGMHQDKSESAVVRNAGSPIISISLGDTCLFRFGNSESRTGEHQYIELVFPIKLRLY